MRTLALDATAFINHYDRLGSTESNFNPRTSTLTISSANDMYGDSYGAELAATWEPRRSWRLRASYSLLRVDLDLRNSRADLASAVRQEGSSPWHQWQIVSMTRLGSRWDLTAWLRHQSRRTALAIRAYTGFDLRLAFRPTVEMEVALVGNDLLDRRHPEFVRTPGFPANSEIPRSVSLEVRWMQ